MNEVKDYGEKRDYQDLADFIEYCKVKGISNFKSKDLEFSFEKQDNKPILEEKPNLDQIIDMPPDDQMLYASVENLEFKEGK